LVQGHYDDEQRVLLERPVKRENTTRNKSGAQATIRKRPASWRGAVKFHCCSEKGKSIPVNGKKYLGKREKEKLCEKKYPIREKVSSQGKSLARTPYHVVDD
jgi:hypothetical protein